MLPRGTGPPWCNVRRHSYDPTAPCVCAARTSGRRNVARCLQSYSVYGSAAGHYDYNDCEWQRHGVDLQKPCASSYATPYSRSQVTLHSTGKYNCAHLREPHCKLTRLSLSQAGTGSWIYHAWWKSLPDYVEVSCLLAGIAITLRKASPCSSSCIS